MCLNANIGPVYNGGREGEGEGGRRKDMDTQIFAVIRFHGVKCQLGSMCHSTCCLLGSFGVVWCGLVCVCVCVCVCVYG